MTRKLKALVAAIAGVMLLASGIAYAAGLFGNLPPAGGTQYPSTIPLTGLESAPFDTQLTQGLNPATEYVSTSQLAAYSTVPALQFASNTTSFTATTAQTVPAVAGGRNVSLMLTGALAAGATITTPTATAMFAALPGAVIGQTYVLRISNESTGAFAWTVAAGAGVTLNGAGGVATIAQNTSRSFLITFTSATALTMQDIGS